MDDREKVIKVLSNYKSHAFGDKDEKVTVEEIIALLKEQEKATIEPKRIDLEEETKAWLDKMDAVDALGNIADICIDWDGYRTADGLGGLVNEIWAYARYCADRLAKEQEPMSPVTSEVQYGDHLQHCPSCGKALSNSGEVVMTQMKGITCCGDCGYYNWKKHKCTRATDEGDARDNFYADCPLPDVVAVQTPQVLSLDDIHRGMVVWLEDKDKPEPILAIGGASAGGAKCYISIDDLSIMIQDAEYNIRWRAWTDCPSKEEMGATPWK